MKTPWEDKDAADTGGLGTTAEGSAATRIAQEDRILEGAVRGKKEKQQNWKGSGEIEICLHFTFPLTIHIHLKQNHCLFS